MNDETSVGLDVMLTAEVPTPRDYIFRRASVNRLAQLAGVLRPGGDLIQSPCLAYIVTHPSAGTILLDTGMHPDAGESLRKDFGPAMGLLFRNLKPAPIPFDAQLRSFGVEPDEVERVVMTHLHVDHTSAMRLLPRARFVCSREEWAATRVRAASREGYVGHHLPAESRMDLVDFAQEGEAYGPFSRTIDLLGDGSIRLVSTPGHTRGHLSVLLRVADGQEVLVVGDAVYTLRSLREEILPMLTADDDTYLRSLREIKTFSEDRPDVILVPSHDPTAWHDLQHGQQGSVR